MAQYLRCFTRWGNAMLHSVYDQPAAAHDDSLRLVGQIRGNPLRHPGAVGPPDGNEGAVDPLRRVEGAAHQGGHPQRFDMRHRLGIGVEDPTVVLVDDRDGVAGRAQYFGKLGDPCADPEGGVEEQDLCHRSHRRHRYRQR